MFIVNARSSPLVTFVLRSFNSPVIERPRHATNRLLLFKAINKIYCMIIMCNACLMQEYNMNLC